MSQTHDVTLTIKYWSNLTKGAVRGLSEAQIEEVAIRCVAHRINGQFPGVWHEASVVTNTLATCQCAPCVKLRSACK